LAGQEVKNFENDELHIIGNTYVSVDGSIILKWILKAQDVDWIGICDCSVDLVLRLAESWCPKLNVGLGSHFTLLYLLLWMYAQECC